MPNLINIAGASTGNNVKLDNMLLDVYSRDILFQATPILKFGSVAQIRTELQATSGDTIKFLKYAALLGKSDIAETSTVTTDSISNTTISITVSEHVKAVGVSERLLLTAQDDVLRQTAQLLGQHYGKDMDRIHQEALLTLPSTLYGKARANRAGLTAVDYMDIDLIRDAVVALAIAKAPKFNGDAYVCFIHPSQARQLKKDGTWVNVQDYATPENFISGELGRIDDVRFVQTTNITKIPKTTQQIWRDSLNTGDVTAVAANAATDVYQAILVGDYCLAHAIALPVEMRDNGVQDFGRSHALAYYHLSGSGLIESAHGIILETA